MGTDPIPERARADDFKFKKGLWRENDKDTRLEMDQREKVRNIAMPQTKNRKKLPSTPNHSKCKNLVPIQS